MSRKTHPERSPTVSADRARRKADILRALEKVCSSLARLPASKPDRGLYREVAAFLTMERRRLVRISRKENE